MHKIWLVAKREYLYNLRKPSFLFAAFGTPLLMIGVFALVFILGSRTDNQLQQSLDEGTFVIGYVDQAGIVEPGIETEAQLEYPGLFIPVEDVDTARAALDSEEINAYLVIPEGYMQTGSVQLYSYESIPPAINRHIRGLLVASVNQQVDVDLPVTRIANPVDELTIFIEDSGREITRQTIPGLLLLPFVFAVVFTLASQVTSGFLMSGLVEEKTNRVIEILMTSITPMQLLTGKIIGLGVLGLTQLAVWIAAALIVLSFDGVFTFLEGVTLPLDLIVFAVIYFLLGYFLTASIMSGIGSVVGSEQESRQYAGIISLVLFIPYFFIVAFLTDPNGTIPTILSIFPFTAPMAMIIRIGIAAVPAWQLALSIGLLLLTTTLIAWMSAKIFRWGLLMYGKRLGPRLLLNVLRGRDDVSVTQSARKEASA